MVSSNFDSRSCPKVLGQSLSCFRTPCINELWRTIVRFSLLVVSSRRRNLAKDPLIVPCLRLKFRSVSTSIDRVARHTNVTDIPWHEVKPFLKAKPMAGTRRDKLNFMVIVSVRGRRCGCCAGDGMRWRNAYTATEHGHSIAVREYMLMRGLSPERVLIDNCFLNRADHINVV